MTEDSSRQCSYSQTANTSRVEEHHAEEHLALAEHKEVAAQPTTTTTTTAVAGTTFAEKRDQDQVTATASKQKTLSGSTTRAEWSDAQKAIEKEERKKLARLGFSHFQQIPVAEATKTARIPFAKRLEESRQNSAKRQKEKETTEPPREIKRDWQKPPRDGF